MEVIGDNTEMEERPKFSGVTDQSWPLARSDQVLWFGTYDGSQTICTVEPL